MVRRSTFDPLASSCELRWFEIRDMAGTLIDSRALPAGTDLKRTLVAAMLEHIDNGWTLGEFSSRIGTFFCNREGQRRMVNICVTAPNEHAGYGFGHLVTPPELDR
jgi:hypothetical protein